MSQQTTSARRHPLVVLIGFTLLGLAAAMLLFGGSLLRHGDGRANESAANTASVIQQAGELVPAQSADEIYSLDTGGISAGDVAPEFIAADLAGQSVRLSDFQGQPLILNFWATWCPPCRVEMPDLQKAFQQHADDGLQILALDQQESAEAVGAFFHDEMGLSFTPLLDANGAIASQYGVYNFPTSVFVNAAGEVTAVHRGMMTFAQIEGYLQETLGSK
ncbi:MAG: TlpA family protein disulfide reductase [Anaerolineales bacterium]|nr:TlpA family protein disulfide reductase [Anaerolineales bacterium]MCB8950614.1 TlpA family protein disulfide reductase [Ardenticatenales bacterium]